MGLITKGSNGKGLATTGIVRDSRQAGSSILELQSTKNFVDNNELFHFAQWTTDTVNKPVPGTLIEGTAKLIGSGKVFIERIDPGFTDIGSSIGDIFMIKPTTGWVNDLYDALTETLNQDGTLRDDVLEEITAGKQDTLVSGTNIRTVNNQSLVGSGNISTPDTTYSEITEAEIEGGNGTTLRTITARRAKKIIDMAKDGKQDKLVSGQTIKTINDTSLLGAGNINVFEVPEGGVLGQVIKKQAEGYGWEDESGGNSEAIIVQNTEPDPDPSVIWVNPDETAEDSEAIIVQNTEPDPDPSVIWVNPDETAEDSEAIIVQNTEPDPDPSVIWVNPDETAEDSEAIIVQNTEPDPDPSVIWVNPDETAEDSEAIIVQNTEPDPDPSVIWVNPDETAEDSEAIIVQNTEPDPDPSVIWVNPDETAEGSEVVSVNGKTGVVVLTKADLVLNNVQNTTDLNKPVSTATQAALDAKANVSTTPVVVNHGSTAGTARPSAILVIWQGSVKPTNKQAGDIWVEV